MRRRLGGEAFQHSSEVLRLCGWRQPVARHEILCDQQIAHRRNDSCEQNTDTPLALLDELSKGFQRKREISFANGIAQIENSAFACLRHKKTNIFRTDTAHDPESRL